MIFRRKNFPEEDFDQLHGPEAIIIRRLKKRIEVDYPTTSHLLDKQVSLAPSLRASYPFAKDFFSFFLSFAKDLAGVAEFVKQLDN